MDRKSSGFWRCGERNHARLIKLPKESKSPQIRVTEKRKDGASQRTKESRRWRIPFEVLDVPLFDLLHEAPTLEDVTTKIG